MLIEHLSGQRTLPSTEEELQQHMERKAKREADMLLAATKSEATMKKKKNKTKAVRKAHNVIVIASFSKRAKYTTIAAGATTEEAKAAGKTAAAEVETAFADTIAMQE